MPKHRNIKKHTHTQHTHIKKQQESLKGGCDPYGNGGVVGCPHSYIQRNVFLPFFVVRLMNSCCWLLARTFPTVVCYCHWPHFSLFQRRIPLAALLVATNL